VSWPLVKLGDVAPAKPSKNAFSKSEEVWTLNLDQVEADTGKVLGKIMAPVSEAGTSTHGFDERHVLYSKLRPYLNKVVLPDGRGLATTELVPMLPDPSRLDRKYLAYYLRSKSFVDWVSSQVAGAKMPRVSMQLFWQHEIPLPPLPEQKRIAAILDKADAIRSKRQQAIQLADNFLRAVFLDMFGDPVTNPKGWPTMRVDELCTIVRGSSPRPQGDPRFYGGPVPRLMVADLTRDGKVVTPMIDSLTTEGAKKSRPIEAGTVVMAVSGNVGLTSVLAIDACIHDGFIAFKELDVNKVKPAFLCELMMFLKSTHASRQAGAIFQNLTTSQIKEMEIPIPPLALQDKFLSISRKATELYGEEDFSLFESLSQRAFSGQL